MRTPHAGGQGTVGKPFTGARAGQNRKALCAPWRKRLCRFWGLPTVPRRRRVASLKAAIRAASSEQGRPKFDNEETRAGAPADFIYSFMPFGASAERAGMMALRAMREARPLALLGIFEAR
jgi:hypothetical protein